MCQNISGLHTQLFYNKLFFHSRRRFVVLNAVASVIEVIVIFLQLILVGNLDAFFVLCCD